MAAPKKKVSHEKKRQKAMGTMKRKLRKMGAFTNLVKCDNCGAMKKNHNVCPECKTYKKRAYTSKFSNKKGGKTVIKA